jgi:hypothetical protein
MAPSLTRRDLAAVAAYLQDESFDPESVLDSKEELVDPDAPTSRRSVGVFAPAWLISSVVHAVLLVSLGVLYVGLETQSAESVLYVQSETGAQEELDELEYLAPPEEVQTSDDVSLNFAAVAELKSSLSEDLMDLELKDSSQATALTVELSNLATDSTPNTDLLQGVGAAIGQELKGRSNEMRGAMLSKYGGTKGSEKAVALALQWFAKHQRQDGSWSFDFRHSCRKCSQSGRMDTCVTGATAMALLPFLGAGQTHAEGEYKETVMKGIRFLLRAQDRNGSLVSGGGNMYSHGLSAIALCESYAMTRDQFLQVPAQKALNFTVFAQDPLGGGWRYMIKSPGDTSAVAWQVMALKSGHMAHLSVPRRSVLLIDKFLTSVQSEGGAYYGYMNRNERPGTTAAGLLCRMYLGWDKHHPGLVRGVEKLSEMGPAPNDATTKYHMYYNYYATQVLRHYGGEEWEKWNSVLRDYLVKVQIPSGHQAGSWSIPNYEMAAHDSEMGGRLYYTSLATMILEVYYRHMPVYSESAAEEFPL